MTYRFFATANAGTIPVTPVETAVFEAWLKGEPAAMRRWVSSSGFTARAGQISLISGADGALARVLLGVNVHQGQWDYAGLPSSLPAGRYEIDARLDRDGATAAATGWALGCYRFNRYKTARKSLPAEMPSLVWPAKCDRAAVRRMADATALVRDLINIPAEDMGPPELAAALAADLGADW